jgi:hypothetical protein
VSGEAAAGVITGGSVVALGSLTTAVQVRNVLYVADRSKLASLVDAYPITGVVKLPCKVARTRQCWYMQHCVTYFMTNAACVSMVRCLIRLLVSCLHVPCVSLHVEPSGKLHDLIEPEYALLL